MSSESKGLKSQGKGAVGVRFQVHDKDGNLVSEHIRVVGDEDLIANSEKYQKLLAQAKELFDGER